MIKFFIPVISLGLIFTSCKAQKNSHSGQTDGSITDNQLSKQEKKDGWKLLFDGKTLSGWHTYGESIPTNAWKADQGTIFLHRSSGENTVGGDLITDKDYANFELQLDWKISPNGNSGVCFYVKEDKAKYNHMYETGPEMQVLDNEGHPDGKITKHRSGDLYDLIKSSSEPVKPVGEWNHVVIRSLNGKLDFYLNGVHIIDTHMWDDNWKNLVANSKFKNLPDFGVFKTGKIGLQDHGSDIWFKNIKIREF